MATLKDYLWNAAGKSRDELQPDNPYRDFGFDGDQRRLGWVKPANFSAIKQVLKDIEPVFDIKERFVFIGMGGSINGIKPLLALFGAQTYHTLDSLDPRAFSQLLSCIDDFGKTQVIAISKSGTTKETQLLAAALRDVFVKKLGEPAWRNYFLWLSDASSFSKLDCLGWQGVQKTAIQFNADTDVGGRFSSPHTLIFLLPLFLLLKKDFAELEKMYQRFIGLRDMIWQEAYSAFESCQYKNDAYFSPCVDERLGESFSSWIVQLFQESLGSKRKGLEVKTITNLKGDALFSRLCLDLTNEHPVVSLFGQMYFFQLFIAFYAASKKINFVSQGHVEQYKQKLQALETQEDADLGCETADLDTLIAAVRQKCRHDQHFIEIVLYFYPDNDYITRLGERFRTEFSDKRILVFVGSDWNHQSYQAAFGSNDTFYVLLTACEYPRQVSPVAAELLLKNVRTLVLIAKATHLTIQEKSVLFSLSLASGK